MHNRRQTIYFYLISFSFIVFDQFTKIITRIVLAPGKTISFIPGFLNLTYVENVGAAFGIFHDQRYFLIIVSLIVMVVVIFYQARISKKDIITNLALALIFGGSFSNFLDRAILGHVIDMIHFSFWPVFNIADSFIVIGVFVLMYELFFGRA